METTNRSDLSDIEVTFRVDYYLSQKTASLKIMYHTKAAEEYGVQYQLGYIQSQGEAPRLSPAMGIQEAREQKFAVDIFNGGALLLRMVDGNENELATTKIERENWPFTATGDVVGTQYSLPVPKDRLP